MRSVVVIGAGVGGITAAAKLAEHGYLVTVVEKNDAPGGRCGHKEIDGYQFDTGPTMLHMPRFLSTVFRDLGERMEDHLELTRVEPTYQLHFGDGTDLVLTADPDRMREQLEMMEPGSYSGFLSYIKEGARNFRLAIPRFMERSYNSLAEFLSPSNLFVIARVNLLAAHYDRVSKYFRDERLRTAFTFQDLYVGLSPYIAPGIFSLLQYTEFADGVWYPKGGMYRIVQALVTIAEKLGVQFVYNKPVARIDLSERRATGVTLDDGERLPADIVLANADLSYVYRDLLPHDNTAEKLERKRSGTSAVTFHWGLDKRYPQFETHNLFFASDIRGSYEPIFDQRGLPVEPHFYVQAPTRVDPTMAPPEGDAITLAIPSAHIDKTNPQDWNAIRDRARGAILARLQNLGIDDIEEHIEFEFTSTPPEWEKRYNLVNGSTHGLSHELRQMAYFRPHNRHARYRNLYFVGASTHPGTGLPNVLVSAGFAVQRILEDDREAIALPDSRINSSLQEVSSSGYSSYKDLEASP